MRKLIATITLVVAAPRRRRRHGRRRRDAGSPGRSSPASCSSDSTAARSRSSSCPAGVDVSTAQRALDANPAVAYAVPNYVAHASSIPNDPGPAGVPGGWERTQWNFLPCGSLCGESPTPLQFQERGGLNAPEAWELLKQRGVPAGKGARVAVLDTGVAYMTKKPKFRRSPDFSRKQFLPGYDFVDKDRMPLDEDGHGTHVTGTIAERDRQPLRPHRAGLAGEDHPGSRARLRGLRHGAQHRQGDPVGREPQGPGDQHELRVLARASTAAGRSRGSARRSSTPSRRGPWWSPRPEMRTASRSPTQPEPRT